MAKNVKLTPPTKEIIDRVTGRKKPAKNKQRIEIIKNPRTKKYRVRYIANNVEIISVSEVLETRENAGKNIAAMIKLLGGDYEVVDLPKKK